MEADLKAFVGANDVRAVIVADTSAEFLPMFSFLDANPVHVGGVTVFRFPSDVLRRYANARP